MNTKLKKRMWQHIFTAVTVFIGMFFIAGCSTTWYGTGTVAAKNYISQGYRAVSWSDKNVWQGECFELTIRVVGTKSIHKGCVSERVWNDAVVDREIKITKDYN